MGLTVKERQDAFTEKKERAGFARFFAWVHKDDKHRVRAYVKRMNAKRR